MEWERGQQVKGQRVRKSMGQKRWTKEVKGGRSNEGAEGRGSTVKGKGEMGWYKGQQVKEQGLRKGMGQQAR